MLPKRITIHCSADKHGSLKTARDIMIQHVSQGWRTIGYHFVIPLSGVMEPGRSLLQAGAHVKGHNKDNIGICLIGGLDENGEPSDNFHPRQMASLELLVKKLCNEYSIPYAEVYGHRDWFPDLNGDGKIDRRDWLKECPCFDVKQWAKNVLMKGT